MTWLQAAQLSAFSTLLATGQILFKRGADTAPPLRGLGDFAQLAGNLYVWAALALYGGGTLLWIYLLQQIPLSRAYPFAALGFVLVPIFAWLLFDDMITLRYVAGTLLILIGICLTGLSRT
jgi:drug/metabolite transporter (DMT)-like permease